uniref:WD_REPEATS_REGION domain-containing protein n=1 Tax=Heterorhabditis bacteriophora TaxID=37862 RepID=A0A1I7WB16_HETBA
MRYLPFLHLLVFCNGGSFHSPDLYLLLSNIPKCPFIQLYTFSFFFFVKSFLSVKPILHFICYSSVYSLTNILEYFELFNEKICSIIGMHAHAGCRSYVNLSAAGQRLIRLWSMDERFSANLLYRITIKSLEKKRMN